MSVDFIDGRGDRWSVRECDDTDGCIVVEQFVCVDDTDSVSDEPAYSVHLPVDVASDVARAILARCGGTQ
jgi:hypothetical protein